MNSLFIYVFSVYVFSLNHCPYRLLKLSIFQFAFTWLSLKLRFIPQVFARSSSNWLPHFLAERGYSLVPHDRRVTTTGFALSRQKQQQQTPAQMGEGRSLKAIACVCGGWHARKVWVGMYWSSHQALDAPKHRVQSVGRWYIASWLSWLVFPQLSHFRWLNF